MRREAGVFDAAVTWLAAVGEKAERRRARAARRSASMPLATGPAVVGRWAVAAAGAGYETSRPFGPFGGGLGPDLSPAAGAVRPVVLNRFTRTGAGDGGRGPSPGTLPVDGAVRPVGQDRFTWTGAGDGEGGLALTPCPPVGGPAGPTRPVHADRCRRQGGGQGSPSRSLLLQKCGGGLVPRP